MLTLGEGRVFKSFPLGHHASWSPYCEADNVTSFPSGLQGNSGLRGPAMGLVDQAALSPLHRVRLRGAATAPGLSAFRPHPLTTVVQLGMSRTEFLTSSSVTSTTLQCSSSEGRGSSPFLVTQGCNCGAEGGEGQGHRPQTPATKGPGH